MQTDPIGEVTKLYAWLGEPVTPEFEEVHASIRDRVSVGVIAILGLSILIGWLLV